MAQEGTPTEEIERIYKIRDIIQRNLKAVGWPDAHQHPAIHGAFQWGGGDDFGTAPWVMACIGNSRPGRYALNVSFAALAVRGAAWRDGTVDEIVEAIEAFRWVLGLPASHVGQDNHALPFPLIGAPERVWQIAYRRLAQLKAESNEVSLYSRAHAAALAKLNQEEGAVSSLLAVRHNRLIETAVKYQIAEEAELLGTPEDEIGFGPYEPKE